MEDFIKNIIVEKRFFELTEKEKGLIREWATNEEEFDALKLTFSAAIALNTENKDALSASVKNKLNERFAAKHAMQRETLWNKFLIFFFPRNTQFFKKPAFQLAMVALVVLLIIPFLWREKPAQYAMHKSNLEIQRDTLESVNKASNNPSSSSNEKVNENSKEEINTNEKTLEIVKHSEGDAKLIEPVPPRITSFDDDNFADEIYLEEIVETQSAKRTNSDFQQMDDMPMISSKDMSVKDKNNSPKQIEASETLGLLTALY